MAKKPPLDDSVRLKAQQMREEQARKERRTRTIIIGVVVVVVIAVIAGVTGIILQQRAHRNDLADQQSATASQVLGEYADGRPIVYSHLGVGQKDADLKTVDLYFDYTCHYCAQLETQAGADMVKGAADGEYNLAFHPVTTVGMGFEKPATTASLIVAQKAPEQWTAFHQALFAYFYERFTASDGTVIQDAAKSLDQVKVIAKGVGVPQDVIDTFTEDSVDAYLATTTAAWQKAGFSGRDPSSFGTPEVVVDNTVVNFKALDAQTVLSTIHAALGAASK